jgi:predicted membrane-bound spermidine synthase
MTPVVTPASPSVSAPSRFAVRLAGVGAVVFLANAGLLVLQLVAGRLLSPFIGSSLETWTAVIAAFLAGIAVGNAVGGKVADRGAGGGNLAAYLLCGAVAAGWMIALPLLLTSQGWHTALPLGPRIPVLAFLLCFPVAFALSVLTPLAIRLGVPDVSRTGLVSGAVFGLSTLGCLLGNYLTGFVLIPALAVNQIVAAVAAALLAVAAVVIAVARRPPAPARPAVVPHPALASENAPAPTLPLPMAFAAVFLCSFAGMTLELAATRLLAPVVGVSIYTWTGVIGVMLAGTCLGNWAGGWIADRGRTPAGRTATLAGLMFAAAALVVGLILAFGILVGREAFVRFDLVEQILLWTFSLFFLPMFVLGTVSPQVIRLAVPDVDRAGDTAGRVYAWSTAGAIAGTFATGYVLISGLGVKTTLLLTAAVPAAAVAMVASLRAHPRLLYGYVGVAGLLTGMAYLQFRGVTPGPHDAAGAREYAVAESNYYRIAVSGSGKPELADDQHPAAAVVGPAGVRPRDLRSLNLDHLTHSVVDLNDPTFLHYRHEQIQLEAVYAAKAAHPDGPRVLVIGGGGYTFPRCVKTLVPAAKVDVVEIDPAVTTVAVNHLGFDPTLAAVHHMDGRQFVAERAAPGTYHVVTLDAVNDYSVPYHLLTKECNAVVKRALAPDGVYLVTVIDEVADGKLWKAAYHTLSETFGYVTVLFPRGEFAPEDPRALQRSVIVLYASDRPFDAAGWSAARRAAEGRASGTLAVPHGLTVEMLTTEPKRVVLTDQYSPVDNLMMQVFRRQWERE